MLNLELKNGDRYITNGDYEQDRIDFGYIIRDTLGYEAWIEYKNILDDLEMPEGDDYEQIADEYRGMLLDTMEELECLKKELDSVLTASRLNRNRLVRLNYGLRKVIEAINKNL